MTERKDDIAPLFKHFGGKRENFQELAVGAEARDASERWPLLKDVPLRARGVLPALSAEQRHDRLGELNQDVADIAPPVVKAKAGLGSALNHLGDLRRSEVVRAATPVLAEPEIEAPVELEKKGGGFASGVEVASPVAEGVGRRLFQKKMPVAAVEPPVRTLRVETTQKSGGLFAKKTLPASQPEPRAGGLGGLFARLEGEVRSAPVRDTVSKRPSGLTGLFGHRKSR
jgi:hypothetical protein